MKENEYMEYLKKIKSLQQGYALDGDSFLASFTRAHEELLEDIGEEKYQEFCDWLQASSIGDSLSC